MFLAMDTPFRLGAQFRRPNQGYAVDNLKNSFTFYMPPKRPTSHNTKIHKRSCTFPSIKKNAPQRQILLQDHYVGELPFVYSLEGRKITCERKRTPVTVANFHHRHLSMLNQLALFNVYGLILFE